jgi:hypothetical protein
MSGSNFARGPFADSSFGGQTTDPFTAVAGAMRDAWGLGMFALRAAAQQMGAPERTPGDTFAMGSGNPFATAWEAMLDAASQAASASAVGQGPMCRTADLQPLMARASVVAASSAFSYWRKLMEVSARHQAGFAAAVGDMAVGSGIAANQTIPDEQTRQLTEELRAYFREVGEVAVQEARSLQLELEHLGEELARASAPSDPSAPYQRRWKAKQ